MLIEVRPETLPIFSVNPDPRARLQTNSPDPAIQPVRKHDALAREMMLQFTSRFSKPRLCDVQITAASLRLNFRFWVERKRSSTNRYIDHVTTFVFGVKDNPEQITGLNRLAPVRHNAVMIERTKPLSRSVNQNEPKDGAEAVVFTRFCR